MALVMGVAPLPPRAVEDLYSTGLFPRLQWAMTGLSNTVPVALLDLLVVVAAVLYVGLLVVDLARRRRWSAILGRLLFRTIEGAALVYLAFMLLWGWNYRRQPLTARVSFDERRISAAAGRDLVLRAADALNRLHGPAHAELDRTPEKTAASLPSAFHDTQRSVGLTALARPGRPKRTLLNAYFRAAGVDGMTDPFFLETLLVSDLLTFERPFVVAHEWAHLAGFADEGEANFLGWLTCLRGSPAAQYSGWLVLYREVFGSLSPAVRDEGVQRLEQGPRADLAAITARLQRFVRPSVSAAGWRIYDQYLKANRVEAGAGSYAEIVRLVLGTNVDDRGVPVLK